MIDLNQTVGRLVAERPERARVFEEFEIDYCCGGKKTLRDACRNRRLDPDLIRRRLADADSAAPGPAAHWETARLADLCDHVVEVHHGFLKVELPRLSRLLLKVAKAHWERHPELLRVLEVYEPFAHEMIEHMGKEERVLFPLIRRLAAGELTPSPTYLAPLRVMEAEHDDAARALEEMRRLTDGFRPPADACNTYRAALAGLHGIEQDLHRHVHLENNVLFPRAEELIPTPVLAHRAGAL
jgi:regulator of cell morphogenesis and NO signaling